MKFLPLLQAMRPRQWVKNVLVGAAPAAAGITTVAQWMNVLFAFVSMVFAASGIYLLNDVLDVGEDRLHPNKISRPVASGALDISLATISSGVAMCVSVVIAAAFINPVTALLVAGYLALMGLYSLSLRKVVGIDIGIVAGGFVLRALIGASAVSVAVSAVFVVFIGCTALLIVTGKRLSEMKIAPTGQRAIHRPTLRRYTTTSLWIVIVIASAGMLVSYLIWLLSTPLLRPVAQAATLPFVIMALARMITILHRGEGDEPEVLLYRDRIIQCCVIGWTVAFMFAEYGS